MKVRPTMALSREQRSLVKSVPGLAERVAAKVQREYKLFAVSLEQMIQSAHYGVVLAASSYDPAYEQSFLVWASYKAMQTILDDLRTELRQRDQIMMGRLAALEVMSSEPVAGEHDVMAHDDLKRRELNRYKASVLAGYLQGVAAWQPEGDREEELVQKLDAVKALSALRRIYDDLGPEHEELLRCINQQDLIALAERRGVSRWTLRREREKLQKVVGARLHAAHVREMPAWTEELWTAANNQGGP